MTLQRLNVDVTQEVLIGRPLKYPVICWEIILALVALVKVAFYQSIMSLREKIKSSSATLVGAYSIQVGIKENATVFPYSNMFFPVWRKSTSQHFDLSAVISSLLKTLPPHLPLTSVQPTNVTCTPALSIVGEGEGRGSFQGWWYYRAEVEVLFRHTL